MAKEVIVATDHDSGDEAIYVAGKKVFEDSSVYACDIASAVGDEPIQFSHMIIELEGQEFPENAAELIPAICGTTGDEPQA